MIIICLKACLMHSLKLICISHLEICWVNQNLILSENCARDRKYFFFKGAHFVRFCWCCFLFKSRAWYWWTRGVFTGQVENIFQTFHPSSIQVMNHTVWNPPELNIFTSTLFILCCLFVLYVLAPF